MYLLKVFAPQWRFTQMFTCRDIYTLYADVYICESYKDNLLHLAE